MTQGEMNNIWSACQSWCSFHKILVSNPRMLSGWVWPCGKCSSLLFWRERLSNESKQRKASLQFEMSLMLCMWLIKMHSCLFSHLFQTALCCGPQCCSDVMCHCHKECWGFKLILVGWVTIWYILNWRVKLLILSPHVQFCLEMCFISLILCKTSWRTQGHTRTHYERSSVEASVRAEFMVITN